MVGNTDAGVGPATTSFMVSGVRNGSLVTVRWDRGTVSGDPPTLDLIELEIEFARATRHDPLVQRTPGVVAAADGPDPLRDPEQALGIVCAVIDRVTDVSVGD